MISKVLLGKGVDDIFLGMNEYEIRKKLGAPDRIFSNEYEPYIFVYNQHRYRLSFSGKNGVIETIEIGKSEIDIQGYDFADFSYDIVVEVLKKNNVSYEIEDYGYSCVIYTDKMHLEFEFEKLVSIILL